MEQASGPVVDRLLAAVGLLRRAFVEIGAGSTGGSCAAVARRADWIGLMVETSKQRAARVREHFQDHPNIRIVQKQATPANVNSLIKKAGLHGELAVMAIEIEGARDLLAALDAPRLVRPRLLIVKVDATAGDDLTVIAVRKNYEPVFEADQRAYFVRRDLAPAVIGRPLA